MVEVKKYYLPPTDLIPNSPYPLLHYPRLLDPATISAGVAYDLFTRNGWDTQWIVDYGPTQNSHYHSRAHEAMVVLSGTATIRFGVADTDPDPGRNTHGGAREPGGVEVAAAAGDVFVLPAGVAHKTFDARPETPFARLTPGDGHAIPAADVRAVLMAVRPSGFSMMGAYPADGAPWDSLRGGEIGKEEWEKKVWSVPKPAKDPVLGEAEEGLCGQWK